MSKAPPPFFVGDVNIYDYIVQTGFLRWNTLQQHRQELRRARDQLMSAIELRSTVSTMKVRNATP